MLKVDKTKYKTEMCKNWIEVGLCRYGNKCQFAHGDHELMGKAPPINNNKYKSKTCTTFNEKLYCPYGQRCLFKHEDRNLEEVKTLYYVHLLVLFMHVFIDQSAAHVMQGQANRRLKIFQKICDAESTGLNPVSASPFSLKSAVGDNLIDKQHFISSTMTKDKAPLSSPQLSF